MIYDAEYHIRTKSSPFPADHFNITSSHLPDHFNQGHHRARLSRKDGGHRRRLAVTGEICVDIDKLPTKELEYKKRQCRRLLDCVSQYSLYDLFVYFFADDIGALGLVQKEEKVIVWDENFLVGTGESIQMKIKTLTDSLRRLNFTDTDISWVGQCDDLLKEFHKFNEGASESGRWQGGTVTQVCKGWSTSKVNLCLRVY